MLYSVCCSARRRKERLPLSATSPSSQPSTRLPSAPPFAASSACPKAVARQPLVILTSLHSYFVTSTLLTPSESSHPKPLLTRQHFAPISPLAATLMDLPASVANKRLTAQLSPLDATLTKNRGVWGVLLLTRNCASVGRAACSTGQPLGTPSLRHIARKDQIVS